MSGYGYLIAAYLVTFFGLGGYLLSLILRARDAAEAHRTRPSSGL